MGVLLTICALLCVMGFTPDAAPLDLSSPKGTVRSFVEALSREDMKTMKLCVQGASDAAILDQLFSQIGSKTRFDVKNMIVETDMTSTRVWVEFTMSMPGAPGEAQVLISAVDVMTLEKHGENWRIVPDPGVLRAIGKAADSSGLAQLTVRPIATFAGIVGSPKPLIQAMESARNRAKAASCLSNTKQIALGVIMYTQDYDEEFPRKNASYMDLIMPYIRNRAVFTCPLDKEGTITYSINANIQQATLASIVAPEKTVLLYEGKNMQLDFRHAGTAAVAFVDGHAKLIGAEEAKSLFWYPDGAKPKPAAPARIHGVKPSKKKK